MRSIVWTLAVFVHVHSAIAACISNTSELFAESGACDNVASEGTSTTESSLLQMSRQTDRSPPSALTETLVAPQRKRTMQLALIDAIDDVFLYDHLPKAGGSFVRGVLAGGGNEGKVLPLANVRIVEESGTLSAEDRQHTFTVGSVRNPCDYYVSCWAFSGQVPLVVANTGGEEFYGTSEGLNTTDDQLRFGKWLRNTMPDGLGPGLLTSRLLWSYFNESVANASKPEPNLQGWKEEDRLTYANAAAAFEPGTVDCWIKTEAMTVDLRRCLELFEQRAGPGIVNWAEYNEIVAAREAEHDETTMKSTANANIWTKNSGHQPTCFYFDKANADFVFNTDRDLFAKFGYPPCCA